MRVLLTGGAGYVGGACFRRLRADGVEAFVLDDLSEGHAAAVEPDRLRRADVRDVEAVARVLRDDRVDAVLHFAALTSVPDSIRLAREYWSVNAEGTLALLDAMRMTGVSRIVMSSTAAVYAHGADRPLREEDPLAPATPYGATKLAAEHMLEGFAAAYGFAAAALRYFNASGADADGAHGEAHRKETHVAPLLIQAALGQRAEFLIFGDDWPTPDGTCVRDFVSTDDLAEAHLLALRAARRGAMLRCNLGSGTGASVRSLVGEIEALTGRPVPHRVAERRPGDPAWLLADISQAERALGWRPRSSDLRSILGSALRWHAAHPKGYDD